MNWAVIVHGGAHTIPPEKIEPHKAGCLRAVAAAVELLAKGGAALDAVEAAVRVLEDDPVFNAGFGSMLNAEGEAEMDAGVMEGRHLRAGAVASIQGVRHPISIARRVLEQGRHVLITGAGARRVAEKLGAELCAPEEMVDAEQRALWRSMKEKRGSDTVGCVVLDTHGDFAAGTSTGGHMHKLPGRIGDSPIVGLGFYADNTAGACSMTGDGEAIMRLALAYRIVHSMREGRDADQASEEAIAAMATRIGGEGGCIAIDRQGRIGTAHNAQNLACAYQNADMPAAIATVRKNP